MRRESILAFLVGALAVSVSLAQPAHDVGVAEVLSPRGTVDSGQQVVPRVVVGNYGTNPENLIVHLVLDQAGVSQYRSSLALTNVPPGVLGTVNFPTWIPDGRDSMTATAWTVCARDTTWQDDTAKANFLVRVCEVVLLDIQFPQDTLDSGDVFVVSALVGNWGNLLEEFDVEFVPGGTRHISLGPGQFRWVTAPDTWVAVPGVWILTVKALVPDDMHPENNTKVETLWVRGTVWHDVGCSQILAPVGFMDTGIYVTPTGRCRNYGSVPETFWTWFNIWDSTGAAVYDESTQVMVGQNDSLDVQFTPDWVTYAGTFTTRCSTFVFGDQNGLNDVKRGQVWVGHGPRGFDVGLETLFLQPPTSIVMIRNVANGPLWVGGVFQVLDPISHMIMYADSFGLTLPPRSVETLYRQPLGHDSLELFWRIWAEGDTNPANDTFRLYWLGLGVEESRQFTANSSRLTATIVSSALWLTPATSLKPQAASLLDIMGRKALALKPGANDVSCLPAGIYFVRQASGVERGASAVRRVLIAH